MSFPKKLRQFSRSSEVSAATWSLLLLAIVATPFPLATALLDRPVLAQSPSPAFPLPTAVPSGTTVRINGSSSLESVNEALKQRFESQFSGTEVEAAYDGSDEALQQLLNGSIDLAAIGRPLTEQEQAQGLVAVPVARNKIAVVVGNENPFNDSLTSDQFARIFRGEVTSWSQVGGEPTPIRFIDRPEDSDIRRSFQQYPVFQTAPFAAGANAVGLTEDTAEAVAEELAADGIGYVIADQLAANPNMRALLMHDTPPTDPLYPFSQPLSYVYRGPNPSPEVQAFLGYAAAPENQPIVEEARRAGVVAAVGTVAQASPSPEATPETSPSPAVSPTPEATTDPTVAPSPDASPTPTDPTPGAVAETDRDRAGVPWWLWLLAIPLLGALLWWLLRDRSTPVPPAAVVPPVEPGGRMILTPRNCREGYVYWEVPDRLTADLRSQNRPLKVRLHDVTEYGITDYHATNLDLDRPRSQTQTQTMTQFDCDERSQDLHIPIPVDNHDYVAELGYFVDDDRWVRVAQSAPVRVPACEPVMPRRDTATETASAPNAAIPLAGAATALGVGAAGAAAARSIVNPQLIEEQSRIILTPRSPKTAYVYWEVPKQHKESLRQQGGRDLRLRIYDTTGIDIDEQSAHSMREYRCDELAQDMHVPIPATDRDYVAELGYVTEDRRWLRLARSAHVHMPVMPLADRGNDGATGISIPKPPDATSAAPPVRPIPRAAPPDATGSGVITGATSPTSPASPASPTTKSTDLPSRTTPARADDRRRDPNTISDATKAAGAALAGGAAAVGAGITQAVRNRSSSDSVDDRDSLRDGGSVRQQQRRIILVPRSSNAAYAYWEVSEDYKDELRRQGGQILMLRIHDATDLDIDYQPAHSTQDYVCDDNEQDKHVTIPVSDRDYVAELGYVTDDGRWLRLIRSLHIRVPSDGTTL